MSPTPIETTATDESNDQERLDETHSPTPDRAARAAFLRASTGHEKWIKVAKRRGRVARDPRAQSIRIECQSIDDMKDKLQNHLLDPIGDAEHTTLEFPFPQTAAFMVDKHRLGPPQPRDQGVISDLRPLPEKVAISTAEALTPTADSKVQLWKQKAVVKTIIEVVEKADGFRYSYNNNWYCKEERANRFSYYCNDSPLNKGRAASGAWGKESTKMRKPVYDCHGQITVKFSGRRQALEVHYRHNPIHATYLQRAPPARRDSKRRRIMEVLNPVLPTVYPPKKRKVPGTDKENAEVVLDDNGQAPAATSPTIITAGPAIDSTELLLDDESTAPSDSNLSSSQAAGETSELTTPAKRPPVTEISDRVARATTNDETRLTDTVTSASNAQPPNASFTKSSEILPGVQSAAYTIAARTPAFSIMPPHETQNPPPHPPPQEIIYRLMSERDYWKARAEEAERHLQFTGAMRPQHFPVSQSMPADQSGPRPSSLAMFGMLYPPGHRRTRS